MACCHVNWHGFGFHRTDGELFQDGEVLTFRNLFLSVVQLPVVACVVLFETMATF